MKVMKPPMMARTVPDFIMSGMVKVSWEGGVFPGWDPKPTNAIFVPNGFKFLDNFTNNLRRSHSEA